MLDRGMSRFATSHVVAKVPSRVRAMCAPPLPVAALRELVRYKTLSGQKSGCLHGMVY